MAMQLLDKPTYIKKGDLKPNTFAFESLKYRGSETNKMSKWPGTPGSINHTFEDEEGKRIVISGDTVMNRNIESDVWPGRTVGLFYKGKLDDNGTEVNYHNWQLSVDSDEKNSAAPVGPTAEPTVAAPVSDDMDSLA